MSFLNGLIGAITQPLIGLRATEYTIVACGALLVHEYFLTLDREVFYVWGSQMSPGKIIFFLNRYSPVVDTVLAIYILTGVKDPKMCPSLARATAWMFVSGMFISEIILAMRTYAIWSGRRSVLIFLIGFTLAVFAAASVLTERFLDTLTFVQIPAFLGSLGITCAPMPAPGQTYLEFMVFMVNQAVIAALTLYRGLQQYRVSRHPMVKTLFQDGLLYYVYTLVFSVANVVVAVAAPIQYGVLLELPLRVVSSICCTRVLLNIRGAYFNPNETGSNGIIVPEKRKFKWGTGSGTGTDNKTVIPSDYDPFDGTSTTGGWTWGEGRPAQLSLRPMTPFECSVPEID